MALIKRLAMRRKIRGVSEEELAANPLSRRDRRRRCKAAAAISAGAAASCAGAPNTCSGRAP